MTQEDVWKRLVNRTYSPSLEKDQHPQRPAQVPIIEVKPSPPVDIHQVFNDDTDESKLTALELEVRKAFQEELANTEGACTGCIRGKIRRKYASILLEKLASSS